MMMNIIFDGLKTIAMRWSVRLSSSPLFHNWCCLWPNMCLVSPYAPFLCITRAFFSFFFVIFSLFFASAAVEDLTEVSTSSTSTFEYVYQYLISSISALVLSAIATVLIFAFIYQRYQSSTSAASETTASMLKIGSKSKGQATGHRAKNGDVLSRQLDAQGKVHGIDYENQSHVDVSCDSFISCVHSKQ